MRWVIWGVIALLTAAVATVGVVWWDPISGFFLGQRSWMNPLCFWILVVAAVACFWTGGRHVALQFVRNNPGQAAAYAFGCVCVGLILWIWFDSFVPVFVVLAMLVGTFTILILIPAAFVGGGIEYAVRTTWTAYWARHMEDPTTGQTVADTWANDRKAHWVLLMGLIAGVFWYNYGNGGRIGDGQVESAVLRAQTWEPGQKGYRTLVDDGSRKIDKKAPAHEWESLFEENPQVAKATPPKGIEVETAKAVAKAEAKLARVEVDERSWFPMWMTILFIPLGLLWKVWAAGDDIKEAIKEILSARQPAQAAAAGNAAAGNSSGNTMVDALMAAGVMQLIEAFIRGKRRTS